MSILKTSFWNSEQVNKTPILLPWSWIFPWPVALQGTGEQTNPQQSRSTRTPKVGKLNILQLFLATFRVGGAEILTAFLDRRIIESVPKYTCGPAVCTTQTSRRTLIVFNKISKLSCVHRNIQTFYVQEAVVLNCVAILLFRSLLLFWLFLFFISSLFPRKCRFLRSAVQICSTQGEPAGWKKNMF